jgi:hypothetical protein
MQKVQELWKTRNGKIGIGVGSLVFFCVCCLIVAALSPSAPAEPALSQEQIQETALAMAWQSFTQTAAALPANTSTPAPTKTPFPSPTVDVYRNELAARFGRYNEAFQLFAGQTVALANDNTLIVSDEWKVQTAVSLVMLESAAKEIESIPGVNAQYEKLDSYMKAIAQETYLLVSNYASGIDNLDLNALNRANANIELITQYTRLAGDELEKIK